MPVTASQVGREICEALGLPMGRVTKIDLHFHAREIVTATVEFQPELDQLEKAITVLRRYELHEKSSEAEPVDG